MEEVGVDSESDSELPRLFGDTNGNEKSGRELGVGGNTSQSLEDDMRRRRRAKDIFMAAIRQHLWDLQKEADEYFAEFTKGLTLNSFAVKRKLRRLEEAFHQQSLRMQKKFRDEFNRCYPMDDPRRDDVEKKLDQILEGVYDKVQGGILRITQELQMYFVNPES